MKGFELAIYDNLLTNHQSAKDNFATLYINEKT